MQRRKFLQATAASGAVVWSTPRVASAGVLPVGSDVPCADGQIFVDDFDQECTTVTHNGYCANYGSFANWDVVSGGTVDVVVGGRYGSCDVPSGRSVDLAGSTNQGGKIVKKGGIAVVAGRSYLLRFSQGSNGSNNTAEVVFGDQTRQYAAPGSGCVERKVALRPTSSGTVELSFRELTNDNSGSILDDVSVTEFCDPDEAYTYT